MAARRAVRLTCARSAAGPRRRPRPHHTTPPITPRPLATPRPLFGGRVSSAVFPATWVPSFVAPGFHRRDCRKLAELLQEGEGRGQVPIIP